MTNTSRSLTVPRRSHGVVVWFTGLSGAGKTTVAHAVAADLEAAGQRAVVLDGDVVRARISKDLGFSRADRDTNVARIAELAREEATQHDFVLVAVVSPYREARDAARTALGSFVEVHVSTPLATCAARDAKGLYARAFAGEIQQFTGVSDPYEPPLRPELTLDTTAIDVPTASARVVSTLTRLGWLAPPQGPNRDPGQTASTDPETST